MKIDFKFYPVAGFKARATNFTQAYDLVDLRLFFTDNDPNGPDKTRSTCLFCGKDWSTTTFFNHAHVISNLLGEHNVYSDFECDQCNKLFGKTLENDLAAYWSISRSLNFDETAKRPGFVSAGQGLFVRHVTTDTENLTIIERESDVNCKVVFDKENGNVIWKYKKNGFRPLKVYKAMLKAALSVLPKEEVERDYVKALDFLMDTDGSFESGCFMNGYSLPIHHHTIPQVLVFKKRNPNARIHTHVVALYSYNMVLVLYVPLHCEDLRWYNKTQPIQVPLYPPLFSQFTRVNPANIKLFHQDYSSNEKISNLWEELVVEMDPAQLANAVKYNGETKEYSSEPFNPSEIMKMVIRKDPAGVDPEVLMTTVSAGRRSSRP